MSFKIVVDSCCDIVDEMKEWDNFSIVPLTLMVNDYQTMDDESFDQDDFIARMNANNGLAKSACPSPEAFKKACEGNYDEVYIMTITDKLSGSYNSALQGKLLYEEENNDDKKIYVFNSLATSGLETLAVLKLYELASQGLDFDEVIAKTNDYIVNHEGLYFCLESLDALKSNGRLFALAAKVLEKIRVKLVCRRTTEGNISLAGQDITINRALIKMAGYIAEDVKGIALEGQTVIISHVCCPEKAQLVADKIREKTEYENIRIIKASGLNSLYASDGGIIVSFTY
ncbi:MAG: DegV family EDD domain-containing protein [Eubacterium sp.]|nr:DegV family EDD domain-containing protein [Eubacterium sp.]